MDSIEILTGQHVTIDYKPANVLKRIFAGVLDVIIQILYALSAYYILYEYIDDVLPESDTVNMIAILLAVPILFYNFMFEAFMGGQTPGKMILKIKVTNLDGSTTGIGGYFLRWVLRFVDLFMMGGVGIFFIVFTKNHQRIGDLAARTIVVNTLPKEVRISPEFYSFGENYAVTYPQVEKLTAEQAKLIMDILEIPVRDEFIENEYLDKLAMKTKSVLNITSSDDDRSFLIKIVKDYNYFATLGF